MSFRITRRTFAAAAAASLCAAKARNLAIMCNLPVEETACRKVLDAARNAGFEDTQIHFPWDRATPQYLRKLPIWIDQAGLKVPVLSAYVNCAAPENVIMNTRESDFDRAIEFAPSVGAKHLIAWTGGFGRGLMTADPRNFTPEAPDSIRRFLEPRYKKLQSSNLTLGLETYITLVCPDAPRLHALLAKMPRFVSAVLDPPNLTPVARYPERDAALREMFDLLRARIGVIHLKDFRLKADGTGYDLPGPLDGEMNYRLFASLIDSLPDAAPLVAEHIAPDQFSKARTALEAVLL